MRVCLALLVAAALAGCASHPQVVTRTSCLPMASYNSEQQSRVADELQKLPLDSETGQFMIDYGLMRAANRACQKSGR